jgi:CARDB
VSISGGLGVSAAWASTPSSTVGSAPAPIPGKTTAALTACHVAGDLADRYATFAAQMVASAGTQQMSLRLQLFEHTPGSSGYRLINGVPGFGVWESSVPGIGVFNYSQEVTSLTAPASFRVVVGYRWLDAGHHVLKRSTRTTVACAEPAQLPNLVPGSVAVAAGGGAGMSAYSLTVRNDGSAPAGPFDVGLSVGGVALADQTVSGLAAGAHTVVAFTGPACASGGTLDVVVNPNDSVAESTDVDNSRTVACK